MKVLSKLYIILLIIIIISIITITILDLKTPDKQNHLRSQKTFFISGENQEETVNLETTQNRQLYSNESIVYPLIKQFYEYANMNFRSFSGGNSETNPIEDTSPSEDAPESEEETENQNQPNSPTTPNRECIETREFITTPPNFKVAFIGDTGHETNFRNVLQLIRNEGTDLVLHQGDLGYNEDESEAPRNWIMNIEEILDPISETGTFPYFYSIGNHDEDQWNDEGGYHDILLEGFNNLGVDYLGTEQELGIKTSFYYNGLFITLSAPGINHELAPRNPEIFLNNELRNSNALWNICSWHKNQEDMQAGDKGDETGWGVYETCREYGALIATGHSHTYSRTHVLSDMSSQTIADTTDPLTIIPGQTIAIVSGIGGRSIRTQENDGDHFASIYTEDQDANYGALFITFNVDSDPTKAVGYFKNIDNEVIDQFILDNPRAYECEEEVTIPSETSEEEEFVYSENRKLMLSGEEFRFLGVNIYGLANSDFYSCGSTADGGDEQEDYLEYTMDYLADNGVNAIRFWAFPQFTDYGRDYTPIDNIIREANEHNIKLIPTLGNQWDHCPGDSFKTNEWYREDYRSFYSSSSDLISYREHVEEFVRRYKNEEAILMWQLINEAESREGTQRNRGDSHPEDLLSFTEDVSNLIRSIDENHLINLGTLGTGQAGTNSENFIALHSLPNIDVVEAHDYRNEDEALPGDVTNDNTISWDLQVANDLNKPFFIGEAGINDDDLEQRAELFDNKIRALFENGGDGYLIWNYDSLPENYGGSCGGYCFTEGDPIFDVFSANS